MGKFADGKARAPDDPGVIAGARDRGADHIAAISNQAILWLARGLPSVQVAATALFPWVDGALPARRTGNRQRVVLGSALAHRVRSGSVDGPDQPSRDPTLDSAASRTSTLLTPRSNRASPSARSVPSMRPPTEVRMTRWRRELVMHDARFGVPSPAMQVYCSQPCRSIAQRMLRIRNIDSAIDERTG